MSTPAWLGAERRCGLAWPKFGREDFPLPTFGRELAAVYHARTAHEDAPGPEADRLLLRLWLAPRSSRALPPGFEVLWGTAAPGAPRGGIAQAAAR
jgi:hypothetical protein